MMAAPRGAQRMVAVVLLIASACVRGQPHAPMSVPSVAYVGGRGEADVTRTFFDSLASARAADRVRPAAPASPRRTASFADVAWLDILRDTVLIEMVRTAVAQNRDVALVRARIQESRAMSGAARSALYPRANAGISTGANRTVLGASSLEYDAWRVTADVAWEVDLWGRTRQGVEAADADAAAQEAAMRGIILSLVGDVALGYLHLLELDAEHDIALSTLESRRETLALARQRYERGVVSEVDVCQFEAQLAVPSARLAQVDRQRAEQEHALNVLLGEPPRIVRRGGSLLEATRLVTVPDSLPAELLDRRPDVAQAERAYAAAASRIGAAAAVRLPALTIAALSGSQSTSAGKVFGAGNGVYQVQAGLSMPLFTGGRVRDELTATRARAEQARAAYERTALTALREVGDAMTTVRTSHDEVTANETLANALGRARELSELRYRNGVTNFLEVLDAQRGVFDAELTLSQSRLRELTSAVQLYKALGGSWTQR